METGHNRSSVNFLVSRFLIKSRRLRFLVCCGLVWFGVHDFLNLKINDCDSNQNKKRLRPTPTRRNYLKLKNPK
jgi:hypothetical protein